MGFTISTLSDNLTWYVITYFGHLLTPDEWQGYRSVIGEIKMEDSSPAMGRMLQKVFVSTDPAVLKLLSDGPEAFLLRVRERILRENADKVFLNYCPHCKALARTPRAKQCWSCFFSWHDAAASDCDSVGKT